MSTFLISPEKQNKLLTRMGTLGIREEDILEKFIKGSGPGGQKINTSSSCVYLLHKPTGIEIKCQRERSQVMNRFLARRILCDKVDDLLNRKKSKIQQDREKVRRQKRRRSRRQKEKVLKDKKIQGKKKEGRRGVKE